MPVSRLRLIPLVAILIALAAFPTASAHAERTALEIQRIAEFARRYKQLQHRLLLEREEQDVEWAGQRLVPAPGDSGFAGPPGVPAPSRHGQPAPPLGGGIPPLGVVNVRANDPTLDGPAATQSEVSLAANGDNVLLAFNDGQGIIGSRTHTQGYAWSTNGGQSFTDGGAPPSLPGWLWDSDPVVAVNGNTGEFWYLGLNRATASNLNGIALVKATFSGGAIVWGTPHMVRAVDDNAVLLDKPWMAVDPASGRLHVVYTSFGAYTPTDTIEIQSSSDGGLTWSNPLALSDPADDGYVQGARVAVGPAGEVVATWFVIGQADPFRDTFPLRKSTNGGASFTPAAVAASVFSNFSSGAPGFNRARGIDFPTLAVDRSNGPQRGRVYVGWQECVDFYHDLLGTLPGRLEAEPNDSPALANAFTIGDSLRGTLGTGDLDYYKFTATQGQTVVLFGLNWNFGLDMSMRLLCADGSTMLALSASGVGQSDLVVFSIPTTGTYYLRLKDLIGSGNYTVYTGLHGAQPLDRARDHRDVFVASSDDGVAWSTPRLVNSDPPWLDNWLPEIAVSKLGKVYASWYDWRDAPAAGCNAQSQVYLANSDDSGVTWATLGALSDAASDWTDWSSPPVKSNLQPNQGDYNALFADTVLVYGAWSDARDADVNVYTARFGPGQPTAVQRLTLGQARPNPTSTDILVTFELPTNAPATLQMLDLSGRKIYSIELGSFGPGRQTLDLGSRVRLRSGIYFVRLAQSGQEATTRISVVR